MPLSLLLALTTVPLEIRHDLQRLHDRMARQYVAKDYDAMVAMTTARFAPEFRFRKLSGPSLNLLSISDMRDDELSRLAKGKGDGPVRWATRLGNWNRQGETLTVTAFHDVDGEALMPDGRYPVHFRNAVSETWVRRDGEWKAVLWQELSLQGMMDGHRFQFGKPQGSQDVRAGTK